MKKFILAIFVVSVGVVIFAVRLRAEGIREGKWSMTMVTKMGGMEEETAKMNKEMENMSPEDAAIMKQMMGKMNMQMDRNSQGITTTVTQCISNQNPVPDVNMQKDCKETHTMDGYTVNFHVTCDESKSDSIGQMTYTDDSMEGEIKSHQVVDGKEVNSTIEISGKYVEPCS